MLKFWIIGIEKRMIILYRCFLNTNIRDSPGSLLQILIHSVCDGAREFAFLRSSEKGMPMLLVFQAYCQWQDCGAEASTSGFPRKFCRDCWYAAGFWNQNYWKTCCRLINARNREIRTFIKTFQIKLFFLSKMWGKYCRYLYKIPKAATKKFWMGVIGF